MIDISKRVALVTGANKGIGFEIAKQLAQAGVSVLLGARDAGRGTAAVAALADQNLEVAHLPLDVTDGDSISQAARAIADAHGRLDILVNNAGIVDPNDGPPSTASIGSAKRVFETNFFGVLAITQAMIPLLRKSASGQVVMLSSSLGSIAMNGDPTSPYYSVRLAGYNASKAALNMLTVQLAQELQADGIGVNSVCPGFVDTDLSAHQGPTPPVEAARLPVDFALGGTDGASGKFRDINGDVRW